MSSPDADCPTEVNAPPPQLSAGALEKLSSSLSALRLFGSLAPSEGQEEERTFGRFRLREILGRGKFGVVFLADDPRSGRQVALKLPQPDVLADPFLAGRFSRDAEAAGALSHPGIVPIHEAGSVGPVPYLVMGYVPGPTLSAWLARALRGSVPVAQAVAVALALTEAVQYAHERGVLHCDLKPANVLLHPREGVAATSADDDLSAYRPVITDFGLARLLNRDPEETRTYLLAGTPPYMAPEQARGTRRDLTARCDVHALAAILYELLTGRQPYSDRTDAEQLGRLLDPHALPARPRAIRPGLPRDLEAIVLKGLEKDPQRRYGSAAELADDLLRFSQKLPTRARPLGALGRAARWAARRPVLAFWLLSFLLVTAAALGLAARLVHREGRHRQELELAEQSARLQEFHAGLHRVRQRRIVQADGWAERNLDEVRRLAATAESAGNQPELCSEAAAALAAPSLRLVRELAPGKRSYVSAFSPDWAALALGEHYPVEDGRLRVWLASAGTGEVLRELSYPVDREWEERHGGKRADGARSLAYSPDGRWLVLGTRGGRLVRWRLDDSKPVPIVWPAHPGGGGDHARDEIRTLWFSDDGTSLLSGTVGGVIRSWDVVQRWQEMTTASGLLPTGRPVSPGHVPISAWDERGCAFFPLDLSRKVLGKASGRAPNSLAFCLSPTGQIASVVSDQWPRRWMLSCDDPGVRRPLLGPSSWHDDGHRDLAFTADGRWVITTSEDPPTVGIWDPLSGSRAGGARLVGGGGRLGVSPDGARFAVCDRGRGLLFEVSESPVRRAATCGARPLISFATSAGGHDLATYSETAVPNGSSQWFGTVTLSRRTPEGFEQERQIRVPIKGLAGRCLAVRRSGRGVEMAVAAADREGKPGLALLDGRRRGTGPVSDVRFGPDGRLWAAEERGLRVWSGEQIERAETASAEEARAGAVLSCVLPTGAGVFAGRRDGRLVCFDGALSRKACWTVFEDQEVTSLAVRQDGLELLAGGSRGALACVSLPSGKVRLRTQAPHEDAIRGVGYLPGGVTLTASEDRSVRLWDETDRLLLTLQEGGPIQQVALAGGELFVLVRGEWGVRVWDLNALRAKLLGLGLSPGWSVPPAVPFEADAGPPQGLVAEVFDDKSFGLLIHRRTDRGIDLDWTAGPPSPWLTGEWASCRWTGYLKAPRSGRWEFRLVGGPATLWLGGSQVSLQDKKDNAAGEGTVEIPGTPVSFRLDHVRDANTRHCRLLWRRWGSGEPFTPIPPSALFPDRASAFGGR